MIPWTKRSGGASNVEDKMRVQRVGRQASLSSRSVVYLESVSKALEKTIQMGRNAAWFAHVRAIIQ